MNQYFFILGTHSELSNAEIYAKLEQQKINHKKITSDNEFLILEFEQEINVEFLQQQLAGTVKIGKIVNVSTRIDSAFLIKQTIENANSRLSESETENSHSRLSESENENSHSRLSESENENSHSRLSESETENSHSRLSESENENSHSRLSESENENSHSRLSESENENSHSRLSESENENAHSRLSVNKFHFGISTYNFSTNLNKIGLQIKNQLKQKNISSRFVSSKENPLSSVIVQKNILNKNGIEFVILKNKNQYFLGQTRSVQDYEMNSKLDYGRPSSDSRAGMLPPKLAQIMVNLTKADFEKTIYDPFCGSGTVLQQALYLGYQKVIGSDKEESQTNASQENLNWLNKTLDKKFNFKLFTANVTELPKLSADCIVTEPFLGPALKGYETEKQLRRNIAELEKLYAQTFVSFEKVLPTDGAVVIVIPSFLYGKQILSLNLQKTISNNFKVTNSWQYSRPNQHLIRNIYKLKKI